MGNSSTKSSNISTPVHLTLSDFLKPSITTTASLTVTLHASPSSAFTSYTLLALRYKSLPVRFIPTEGTTRVVICIGSHTATFSIGEKLLRFVDSKVPLPQLVVGESEGFGETTPLVVRVVRLQHRSLMCHVEKMVKWAEDLAIRGGRKAVDPKVGSPKMELRKFGNNYSFLLEGLLEHAQMEERVIFPLLEMADRGICKAANEEHAKDLPVMNGIKEYIKSVGVMDSGGPTYREALHNISVRLRTLQERCKEHFEEEERDVLPLVEALELSEEKQARVVEQSFDVMWGTHSHLFKFLIEGLLPWEAMQYLDLVMRCKDEESAATMINIIVE